MQPFLKATPLEKWHRRSQFKSLPSDSHHNLQPVLTEGRNEQRVESLHADKQIKLSTHKKEPLIYISHAHKTCRNCICLACKDDYADRLMSVSSVVTKKIKWAEDVEKEFSTCRGTLCFQKPASNYSKYTWARCQPFIPPCTSTEAVGVAGSPTGQLCSAVVQCRLLLCKLVFQVVHTKFEWRREQRARFRNVS